MIVDIFKDVEPQGGRAMWARFKEKGDSIQGTYVGKTSGMDGYGNKQIIYEILKDGELYNVGFRETKKDIHRVMDSVSQGQIVGFMYAGEKEFTDRFGKTQKVKIYNVHQDPKFVDEEWLTKHKDVHLLSQDSEARAEKDFSNFGGAPVSAPTPTSPLVPPEDKLAVIFKLAKDRLGLSDQAIAKDKLMELTSIAFIPINYDKIISYLQTTSN